MDLQASFEKCCRLCAEEQDVSIMIFSAEAEAMLLQNKLNNYLLIEVDEDDKLPKNICLKCCTKLQTVCEFIDTARKSQEILTKSSLLLEQYNSDKCETVNLTPKIKLEAEECSDDESKFTEMEISVDPMMVLQNSDETLSPANDEISPNSEDVTHLYTVDSENVTIKLIRKNDEHCENDKKSNSPADDGVKDTTVKPFACTTCDRSFFTELALKNHSWIHNNDEKAHKQYKCSSCEEDFDVKLDFIEHLKEHKSMGLCQLCGRSFRSEKNLNAHMTAHLSSAKSYTCKVCGRSYSTMSNLRTHSITHSNERPYHCHLCKKSFKRNQDLKFHINQHTGAKPYKCPFCEKSFASSGNCYSHRSRMHPGKCLDNKRRRRPATREYSQVLATRPIAPKPPLIAVKGMFKYQCTMCDHSFMKRDNFTYHMYQHTGEKPFQCSFCNEKFVTRRGLLIHHDKEHPSKNRPLALLTKNILLK
ncbi:zinc finger protein 182-like [Achroia grisella]|uniref:zinc finger protein 182-like n=1 Tax=Achroia grisella TaxID=688607 RepID=UPI0027D2313A|nr:zinc finger protein 182-like [Achroia grisella]